MFKELAKTEPSFLKNVVAVATPIALHNLMQSMVGFTDIAMISQLGQISTAAIGLGAQVFFAVCVAIFGISSGGAIFISRCWGKKDFVGLQRFTTFTVVSTLTIAVPLMFVCYFMANDILFFFSKNPLIVDEGRHYLQLTAITFPFTAVTVALSVQLRCVEKGHFPMYMSCISLAVSLTLNYLLIFGHFGLPALGVTGAAISTLTARVLETVITFIFFFGKTNPARTHLFTYVKQWRTQDRAELMAIFLKLAIPIMFMEIGWAIGQGTYKFIYARMGLDQIAAYTAIESIINLFSVLFIGLGNAAAIMIGKQIGLGHTNQALLYAKRFIRLNFLLVIPMGLMLAFTTQSLVHLYKFNPAATQYLVQGLLLTSVCLSLKSYNFLMMSGILRAGGDSRFMVIIGIIGIIGLSCPVSFLVAFYYKLPFIAVFSVALIEENLRNFACFLRYKSHKWLKTVTTS